MSSLTAEHVENIFVDCLFKDNEMPVKEYVPAFGITFSAGFNPERVKGYKDEIARMLEQLPDEFQESGGGMSFLNACNDKHGNQWTGEHRRMEQLFMLGLAVGKVTCQIPRAMWSCLPGGMPYYVVNKDFTEVKRQSA